MNLKGLEMIKKVDQARNLAKLESTELDSVRVRMQKSAHKEVAAQMKELREQEKINWFMTGQKKN